MRQASVDVLCDQHGQKLLKCQEKKTATKRLVAVALTRPRWGAYSAPQTP